MTNVTLWLPCPICGQRVGVTPSGLTVRHPLPETAGVPSGTACLGGRIEEAARIAAVRTQQRLDLLQACSAASVQAEDAATRCAQAQRGVIEAAARLATARAVLEAFDGATDPVRAIAQAVLDAGGGKAERFPCPTCGVPCAIVPTGEVMGHALGDPHLGESCAGGTVDPALRVRTPWTTARRRLVEALQEAWATPDVTTVATAREALHTFDDLAGRAVSAPEVR